MSALRLLERAGYYLASMLLTLCGIVAWIANHILHSRNRARPVRRFVPAKRPRLKVPTSVRP